MSATEIAGATFASETLDLKVASTVSAILPLLLYKNKLHIARRDNEIEKITFTLITHELAESAPLFVNHSLVDKENIC